MVHNRSTRDADQYESMKYYVNLNMQIIFFVIVHRLFLCVVCCFPLIVIGIQKPCVKCRQSIDMQSIIRNRWVDCCSCSVPERLLPRFHRMQCGCAACNDRLYFFLKNLPWYVVCLWRKSINLFKKKISWKSGAYFLRQKYAATHAKMAQTMRRTMGR